MSMLVDSQALDALAEALVPRLMARGFLVEQETAPTAASYSENYDDATCTQFLNRDHLGDSVLDRAKTFFELLDENGEVSSPDLVAALGVKGARSVPANLTNPLKKRARKMRIRCRGQRRRRPMGCGRSGRIATASPPGWSRRSNRSGRIAASPSRAR